MLSTSQLIRCAAAIVLLSCAPTTRAQEMFTFLRPPQAQFAPGDGPPGNLQLEREGEDENAQLPSRLQRRIVR